MPWWIWILIGLAALVGETATMALYLLYFGVAAFIVAALAFAGVLPAVQLIAFVVLAIGLLGVVRPRTLHLLGRPVERRVLTNPGLRTDREGVAVEDITPAGGVIRLGRAEYWTARPYPPATLIPRNTRVRIMYVDGVTAYVEAVEESLPGGTGTPPPEDGGGAG
jgi:membrane protein implicated in regulation of membrane protease activity